MLPNDCLVLEKMDIAVFHAGRSQDQEGQPGRALNACRDAARSTSLLPSKPARSHDDHVRINGPLPYSAVFRESAKARCGIVIDLHRPEKGRVKFSHLSHGRLAVPRHLPDGTLREPGPQSGGELLGRSERGFV